MDYHLSRWKYYTVLLPLVLSIYAGAQTSNAIDSFVISCRADFGFNGVVMVARGKEVLYQRAFGYANVDQARSNTLETKFRLGSISKQFTAFLVLGLVEEKRVFLEARVGSYFKAFNRPSLYEIRIKNLLNHTSGLADYTTLRNFNDQVAYDPDTIVNLIAAIPLKFSPSGSFSYSNSNYFLLALIIERVTGQKFREVLRRMVLEKLGLINVGEERSGQPPTGEATGYFSNNGRITPAPFIEMANAKGAGDLYGAAADLIRWSESIQEQLAEDTLFRSLIRSINLADGSKTIYSSGWGWGLIPGSIFHTGHINGFANAIVIDTARKESIVLLTNQDFKQLDYMMLELSRILRQGSAQFVTVSSDYVGRFLSGSMVVDIRDSAGSLQGFAFGERHLLRPFSRDTFYFLDMDGIVCFERDREGRVVALNSFQDYKWVRLRRSEGVVGNDSSFIRARNGIQGFELFAETLVLSERKTRFEPATYSLGSCRSTN
jgi:CubicO group peptidase (beta-lactamase class C family)